MNRPLVTHILTPALRGRTVRIQDQGAIVTGVLVGFEAGGVAPVLPRGSARQNPVRVDPVAVRVLRPVGGTLTLALSETATLEVLS